MARVVHADRRSKFGDEFTIQTIEDVEPIIEAAKLKRENQNPKSGYRFVGSIPLTVVEQAAREGWINDKAKWAKWMADPDNKRLMGL